MTTNPAATTTSRHTLLTRIRQALPPSPAWETWLDQSGELPPDFTTMPATPSLPDLLPPTITDAAAWEEERQRLKAEFTHWVVGSCPPPPDNLRVEILDEQETAGATIRSLRFTFGPDHAASLGVELLIPPGEGPFPVLVTQHNHRDWALIALRRGYIGCVYAGADLRDDTETFRAAYPEHDWSRLMRRAWAGSRCVDHLLTLPQVDAEKIVITGHSRNGKTSLMAAAYDERFSLVIASSPGSGGSLPARFASEQAFAEGIESITRVFPEWFHPRFRFFAGNEQYLPVDMHQLVALCAPRPCLLGTALFDGCELPWAAEQTYREVHRVYDLLDAPDALHLQWRAGGHETTPTTIDRYLDWCDTRFGRGAYAFPQRLLYPGSSETTPPNPESAPADLAAAITATIGTEPPLAIGQLGKYGIEPLPVAAALGRHEPGDRVEKRQVVFGEYLSADLYLPQGALDLGKPLPVVLWLPPWPSGNGYRAAYKRGDEFYRTAARAGFAVCCFDHIGSGSRVEEAEGFHLRHPEWTLLGKMLRDARAAIDLIHTLPYLDANRIHAVGYATGALIGLHLFALDDRLASLTAVAPPADPAAWLQRYGLASGAPYTLADLLHGQPSRPIQVVTPTLDAQSSAAITSATTRAANFDHTTLPRLNAFDPELQTTVLTWLHQR